MTTRKNYRRRTWRFAAIRGTVSPVLHASMQAQDGAIKIVLSASPTRPAFRCGWPRSSAIPENAASR